MKKFPITFCLLCFVVSSCSDFDKLKSRELDDNTVCEFAPYTTGSSFIYSTPGFGNNTTSYLVLGDTLIDGETWKVIDRFPGSRKYVNCRFPFYTEMILTPGQARDSLVLPMLKLDASVGSSWGYEIETFPRATYRFELISKGEKYTTALDDTYKNVSEVMLESWVEGISFSGTPLFYYSQQMYYFSPDAGLIEYSYGTPLTGIRRVPLMSYSIE